jgi:hypothetical protein
MISLDQIRRRWWPERYCRNKISELERHYKQLMKESPKGTPLMTLIDELHTERFEWYDWLRQIESDKLERRGAKIGVYVEDQPLPDGRSFHHDDSPFGSKYLSHASLVEFRKAVRAREPEYRKERREVWDLWLKAIGIILSGATGVIGAIIGLVALLHKK